MPWLTTVRVELDDFKRSLPTENILILWDLKYQVAYDTNLSAEMDMSKGKTMLQRHLYRLDEQASKNCVKFNRCKGQHNPKA